MTPGPSPLLGWYWLAALACGFMLSVLYYRRQAHKMGVWAPTRAFVVTGVVALAATFMPLASWTVPALERAWGWSAQIRSPLAFAVIAVGLLALVWIERSAPLAAIVAAYGAVCLTVSLYNPENLLFRLGGWPAEGEVTVVSEVTTVALPALVLLAGGAFTLGYRRGERSG